MKKITLELTDEQLNNLINGEEVVVLQSALVKHKFDLETIKEKYESGNYLCLVKNIRTNWNMIKFTNWALIKNPVFSKEDNFNYKLIHKRHQDILEAYLEDSSIEIELLDYANWVLLNKRTHTSFIEDYCELDNYRIKPKEEYPIFKINEDGEIFKITTVYNRATCKLGIDLDKTLEYDEVKNLKTIPYNKERGLYHKQPVWCWDNEDVAKKIIKFYDCKNGCTFSYDGQLEGECFENIEPVTQEQLKTMPFIWEMYKQLKD